MALKKPSTVSAYKKKKCLVKSEKDIVHLRSVSVREAECNEQVTEQKQTQNKP